MTDEEMIEQVAHVLCETGAAASWVPAVQSAYAILPIIKAERVRGGEMVKEAAATVAPTKTSADECETVGQWTRRTLREAIRALSVPAIVEAGDG